MVGKACGWQTNLAAWDISLLIVGVRLLTWPLRLYAVYLRPFVLTDIGGFVSAEELAGRRAACAACDDRQVSSGLLVFCSRDGCKCPWWVLASLWWRTRLRKWLCPAGKFEARSAD